MPENIFYKMIVSFDIRFDTAFHLGSGLEGEAGSDNGIITDEQNMPVLPGSSLKGVFRSTVEKLIASLNLPEIWTCGLQNGLYPHGKKCIGGGVKDDTYKNANKQYQDSNGEKISQIEQNRCSVCELFGSPLSAGRVYINDARIQNPDDFRLMRRDGVGISRDSGISVDGVKYDYDVANPGLVYQIKIEAEKVSPKDLAILALGILEWKHAGIRLGGKTSRGLGHAIVENMKVSMVDLNDKAQRKSYLLRGEMKEITNPEEFFQQNLDGILS